MRVRYAALAGFALVVVGCVAVATAPLLFNWQTILAWAIVLTGALLWQPWQAVKQ